MKFEIPALKRTGPVPKWRSAEKCIPSLEVMYRKAMEKSRKLVAENTVKK